MWPFKKQAPKPTPPKARLCHSVEAGGFQWWSVWVWKQKHGGYWSYVKGTSNEKFARDLYQSCLKHGDADSVVVEQD